MNNVKSKLLLLTSQQVCWQKSKENISLGKLHRRQVNCASSLSATTTSCITPAQTSPTLRWPPAWAPQRNLSPSALQNLTSISIQSQWDSATPYTDAQFKVGCFTVCNFDHIFSVPRPEEAIDQANRTSTTAIVEGATVFEGTYVKSVETEITIERQFKIPGYIYNLTLIR